MSKEKVKEIGYFQDFIEFGSFFIGYVCFDIKKDFVLKRFYFRDFLEKLVFV